MPRNIISRREQQDDFAVASFKRVIEAQQKGLFAEEIVPVEVPSRQGTTTVDRDEGPTRFNEEKLRSLQPAFGKTGTVTAGNASSINDGAAAVVVLSANKAGELGIKPQAKILGYATFSREPEWFTLAPIGAITKLMEQLKLTVIDVDLFEINEAFAVVPMAAMANFGHPARQGERSRRGRRFGPSHWRQRARVLVTLLEALKQRHGRIGIASLCIGGGEAVALAVQARD